MITHLGEKPAWPTSKFRFVQIGGKQVYGSVAATARKLLSMLAIAGLNFFLMCVSELRTKGCCCLGGAPRDSYQKSCSEASWQTSFQTIQVCYAQMWMLHAARNPWSNHPTNSNIKILRKLSSIGKHGSVQ